LQTFATRIVAVFIALSIPTFANAQIIFNEGFEEAFGPENWTVANGNPEGWIWQSDVLSGWSRSGTHCVLVVKVNPANTWMFSSPLTLESGIVYKLSYWYKNQTLTGQMKVTLGNSNTINSQTTILHDYPSILTNSTYLQGLDEFSVPVSGTYYIAFNCYTSGTAVNRLALDDIVLEQVTPAICNGTPASGWAIAKQSVCAATNFTLKLNGVFTASGLSFQWQSSPSGQNNFVDIPGATTLNYTLSQTTASDYRCVVTCSNSNQSSYSNIVTVNTPSVCYCTPPTSSCNSGDVITNVTFGSINNSSSCSDYGGYTDNSFTVAAANFPAGSTPAISVSVGSALNNVAVWIDYNRNGMFEDSEYKFLGTGRSNAVSNTVSIPANASLGLTRMRIRSTSAISWQAAYECQPLTHGETEDYFINITPYVCSGTPTAGTIFGISQVCPGDSVMLTLNGSGSDLSLQWESSPTGANNFTPIAGATTTILRTTQNVSTDYRVVATCITSGLSATTPLRLVASPTYCYCHHWGACSWHYITRVQLGTLSYATSCTNTYNLPPTSPAPALNAGTSSIITVTVNSSGHVAVWIDFNKNGVFDPEEFTAVGRGSSTVQATLNIPQTAPGGITVMRVRTRATGTFTAADACTPFDTFIGETEDYNININAVPIGIDIPTVTNTVYEPTFHITTRITQRDVGLNISDTLGPRLWARKQSSSTWKSFKGTLVGGTVTDGQWDFPVNHDSLGIRRNGGDSVLYYVVAQDLNLPVNLGYQPAAGANHSNVAVPVTRPSIPLGYRLKPRLKDTLYINNYECSSLSNNNGLFYDINTRTLEGNLTVLIENNLSENGAHTLSGIGLNGFSLAIRPANATPYTIQSIFTPGYTPDGCAIKFKGASRVTIDGSHNGAGKYLYFRLAAAGTYFGDSTCQVKIWNSCDSVFLRNLVFQHASTAGTMTERSIYLTDGQNTNIIIEGNEFYSLASSRQAANFIQSVRGSNVAIVKNNRFVNSTQGDIKVVSPANNWIIDSNHCNRTIVPNGYTYDWSAINVSGNGHLITNNFVGGQQPYCGGGFMTFNENPASNITGISAANSLQGNGRVTISNNRIDNIQTGLSQAARPALFAGIYCNGSEAIIANNTIGNITGTNPSFTIIADNIYGITAFGDRPVEINENTVKGLRNKDLPGPNYEAVNMVGISWRNSDNSRGLINGNHIYDLQNTRPGSGPSIQQSIAAGGTIGIYCTGGISNLIQKNIIHDMSTNSGAISALAVDHSSWVPTTVQQNRIYNIGNFGTYYSSCCGGDDANNPIINGIFVVSDKPVDILNNQISLDNFNFVSAANIRGIYHPNYFGVGLGAAHRVIYNTIYIGGTAIQNGGSSAYAALTRTGNNVYNNIFFNERSGGVKGHFAYRLISFPIEFTPGSSANNNLHILRNPNTFAQWGSTPIITFQQWKVNTGFEDKSYLHNSLDITANQFFVDKLNGNLNINSNDSSCWYANQKGAPFIYMPGDYDSDAVRSTNATESSDIGSDEFWTTTNAPERICANGSKNISSPLTGLNYQWQLDSGSGFSNVSDDANHSGTTTNVLHLVNFPSNWTKNKYRCMVDGVSSNVFQVNVVNTWVGSVSNDWENSANWSCGIIPDEHTEVIIYSGTVYINSNVTVRSLKLGAQVNFTVGAGNILTITH
jgi:hypothetical protein